MKTSKVSELTFIIEQLYMFYIISTHYIKRTLKGGFEGCLVSYIVILFTKQDCNQEFQDEGL